MKGKIFLAVAVCLFLILTVSAQSFLKVNEAETQSFFSQNRLQTNLAIENSAANFPARVRLEILDADDKILAQKETGEIVKRGRQFLQIPLEFAQKQDANDLLWCRLRYEIQPENSAESTRGIVSLSEIMPEIFELQILTSDKVFAGMRLRAHVIAVHPLTKKPIKNVNILGELKLDLNVDAAEDELKINAVGKTNDEGFSTLDFEIPANAKLDDDGKITIKGEKNGVTREADKYLDISAESFVYLNLDKPIYQPNQKLFARGLYLNPLKRPLTDENLEFEITDEDDETVYEQTAKTSRFGAANIAWQIPATLKLGKYKLEVKNGNDDVIGVSEFKVTRYDLPNFSVVAKPDKTYYLPGQNTAEIVVSANYLFGKAVSAGKARVVQETERIWNYDEQEYETEEAQTYEGQLNADGNFVARIDLTKAHKNLANDDWKRFEDLHFAAYFTDASTNRTEQKRFDIRISKEAIHVYFLRYFEDVNPKLPFQFYVSTFYADGTPAHCNFTVKGNYEEIKDKKILAEAKTNTFGAGKLEIRFPEKPFSETKNRFFLQIAASDKKGNSGNFADNIDLDEKVEQIRIKTDKTIYLPNENIEANIISTETDKIVFVDVVRNSNVVYSKRIKLGDGRATLQIPFRADFKGVLTIAAYFHGDDENDLVKFSKTIIFPSPDNLKFNVKSLKTIYRPNEEANISFNVSSYDGKKAETALGVVVLDSAIEERAAVEQLPDNYRDLRRLLGTADSFGNLTLKDLNNFDVSKPIDENLQLAAEFLLAGKNYEPNFFASDSYQSNFKEIFKDYFTVRLKDFENALAANYEKSNEFPTDENSLRRILSANGVNFDDLRDAWGTPLKVEFRNHWNFLVLSLKTASADKKFGTEDDFTVKEMQFEWFAKTQNKLTTILNNYTQETGKSPLTTEELKAVWKQSGIDFDDLRDDQNRPLYLTSDKYRRNAQKTSAENIGNLDGETQQIMRVKTVLQDGILFKIRSAGADGVIGGYDDFDLGNFTVVTAEKDFDDAPILATISKSRANGVSGAITGTLFDPVGAVIPGAEVKAENQISAESFSVKTNDEGVYLLTNLPSGKYKVSANSPGFNQTTIENVVVNSLNLIKLNITLEIGAISSTVDVMSDVAMVIDSTSSSVKTTVEKQNKSIAAALKSVGNEKNYTPRVREYFPETLFWSPEIITDKNGRADLKFRLADSLTTWKLYGIASNEAGEIGLVEKEIQTFQPFFAELDPPKILTAGDEIALPVPVRNYTNKQQKVAVSMAENSWSNLLNGATQNIEIAANNSQNAIFNFRAVAPVENGKQKITALAKNESDAIEKPVTVKSNGKEIVETQSKIFRGDAVFDVDFPVNSLANTKRAEVKIYPNMLAHVAESVEGLLQRPHGCGEQTTSSTYPNLMILKIEKDLGKSVDAKIKAQAENYLREGYERLLNYQTPSGGFSYWGKNDTPNTALTAYILRFLNDAQNFINVDEKVIEDAQNWLLKQQQTDGSWNTKYVDTDSSTAYIVRSLSLNDGKDEDTKNHLRRGLDFLKKRLPEIKDSFVLANFALASVETGDADAARIAAEKLEKLSQPEKETLFWTTGNTPFHGWGTTAKIETTALAVQTFLRVHEDGKFDTSISEGLAFLLKNKDKYGVWFSTQTTVNVLDALILLQKSNEGADQTSAEKTEIYINGKKIKEFSVDVNALANPLFVDVSPFLNETSNRIEIKNTGNLNFTQAQIVAAHYISWKDFPADDARYFDLKVNFDKTKAKIGEEIICAVSIARKEKRYGMILAEIGIPPGANVDRDSLEKAEAEGAFSNFDILPDKIVVYLWSSSAPVEFNFKFRPRYGINAQTAPSLVYDYYNEEAKTTVAPSKFSITN